MSSQARSDRRRGSVHAPRLTESEIGPATPPGALRLWHAELYAGYRGQDAARPSTWRYDALYRAAMCEANGIDAQQAGLPRTAAHWFARTGTNIPDAARARRGAA